LEEQKTHELRSIGTGIINGRETRVVEVNPVRVVMRLTELYVETI
jgi:hypothetical protein